MKRKQFTFYSSYWDAIQPLPKKQQAEILLAICDYALNETEPSSSLSPAASVAFNLIRPNQNQTDNKRKTNAQQRRKEKEGEKERE